MTKDMAAQESVYKYLRDTNRPYSVNDIVLNMHKEIGKAVLQRALDGLVADGKVREKTYGKQKVYCVAQEECSASQTKLDGGGADDSNELDSQISQVTDNLTVVEKEAKKTELQFKELQALPTTQEAKTENIELEQKLNKMKSRLNDLKENKTLITVEERTKVVQGHEKYLKEYRKRKRIAMEIVNAVMESYPKDKKSLFAEIGIETDEEAQMPPIQ